MNEASLLYFGTALLIVLIAVPGLWLFYHQVLRELRGTVLALSGRLDELERLRTSDHNEINNLSTLVVKLVVSQERWIAYAKSLAIIMQQNKINVPPSPEEQDTAAGIGGYEIEDRILQAKLSLLFNRGELDDLALNFGLEGDQLRGETREERARELVSYCRRRGKTAQLSALVSKLRPE